MALPDRTVEELNFIEILIAIVIGWILVNLWQHFIDNFTFNTLGLNKDSSYQTFVIALIATIIFLIFVFNFDALVGGVIESDVSGGGLAPPSPPGPIVNEGGGGNKVSQMDILDEYLRNNF